ncbi:MAG: hypothetical protein ABI723_01375 [Bacteroidia bacterium]
MAAIAAVVALVVVTLAASVIEVIRNCKAKEHDEKVNDEIIIQMFVTKYYIFNN